MKTGMLLAYIAVMAGVTYLIRMLPLTVFQKKDQKPLYPFFSLLHPLCGARRNDVPRDPLFDGERLFCVGGPCGGHDPCVFGEEPAHGCAVLLRGGVSRGAAGVERPAKNRKICRIPIPFSLRIWYDSFKQSLKHWKNACRRETPPAAERQRHFSQRLILRAWYNSFKRVAKFQALKLGSIPQMPSAGVSLAGIVIIVIID